jgi:hypothetical protein
MKVRLSLPGMLLLIYVLASPLFIVAEEALGVWSLEGIIIRLLREPAPR